jgi:glyoxylase-like metal-dependent hydrolase (beta-lactamase superfamily II)
VRVGRFTLSILPDTPFRLDGGAMFGAIPKVLWERRKPADAANRIAMTTNCLLLVGDAGEVVLVDAGIGEKLDAKGGEQFGVPATGPRLLERLAAAGIEPPDVTHVLLSHLHFDHCGWSTRRDGESWVPTFPRARYWLPELELAHARQPNERDRPSYDRRNFEPLVAAGVVDLVGEAAEPLPGVRMERAPGHTAGMCLVRVDGGEDPDAVFFADLVPTVAHVPTPWVMGYDLFPVTTMESKQRWLPQAATEGWWCVFCHDPEVPLARLVPGDRPGRFAAEPVAAAQSPVPAGAGAGGDGGAAG